MKFLSLLHAYYLTLHKDEKGASAIEYAIIAGLIAVAIIATVTTIGTDMNTVFSYIKSALGGVSNPSP